MSTPQSDSNTKTFTPKTLLLSRVTGACVLVAVLLATIIFLVTPTTYTAEARLSVGDQSASAAQVPGYANATQTLASDYARYVQDTPELRSTLPAQGEGLTGLGASPIPESNVIRVEATANDEQVAVSAANAASEDLVQRIEESRPNVEAAERRFVEGYTAYLAARADADTAATRRAGDAVPLAARAATLDLQQQALGVVYRDAYSNAARVPRLVPFLRASSASADTAQRVQRDLLAAVVFGVGVGVGLTALQLRKRGLAPLTSTTADSSDKRTFLDALTEPYLRSTSPRHGISEGEVSSRKH